jgi:serine phosphatase RsbU (regulator of sigma subunit)
MRRLNSIQTKLVLTLLLVVGFTAIAVAVSLLSSARRQMRRDLAYNLAHVAALAAMQIDGDQHSALREPGQQFTPPYDAIRKTLQEIVASDKRIRYVYTLRATADGRAEFIVDADTNLEEMGDLGEIYDDASPFLLEHIAKLDGPLVENDFYTDKWGTFLTGYAPVRTSDGRVDAIVGVDIEASWIVAQERAMTWLAVLTALAALLPVAVLGVLVSRQFARPILRLHESVLQVAQGDLEARVSGADSGDEIGDLARAFNQMTADLRAHIDKLAEEQAARQKIEQDLELARLIQRGLLPKSEPNLPGFEIAGWNQAADQTGGDYFDWLELPDGRTLIMLADVTGHGIGPALIVAACRAYLRAAAISGVSATGSGGATLSKVLDRVNNLLHEDVPAMRFVTVVVAIIDPQTNHMAISSAGHAPLIYFEAATKQLHIWDADDLPLAVTGDVHYPEPRDVAWQSGDVLVLVTDGFFEWANAQGRQFGVERLGEFVLENAYRAPAQFISLLHETVLDHADGTAQPDDLTAVVVKKI